MINMSSTQSSLKFSIRWKKNIIICSLLLFALLLHIDQPRFVVDNIPVKLWASRDRGIYTTRTLKIKEPVQKWNNPVKKMTAYIHIKRSARKKPRSATSNQSKIISCSWAQFISSKIWLTKAVFGYHITHAIPFQCGLRSFVGHVSCVLFFQIIIANTQNDRTAKMSRWRILYAHILKWSKLM